MAFNQQYTLQYRTYLKEAVVEALRNVFVNHPDPFFRGIRVALQYSLDREKYPSIIIRFYERSLRSAGVGHSEWKRVTEDNVSPARYQRFKHFLYAGDIEFEIVALSSRDRDWIADALVQIVGMAETEGYMMAFLNRIYEPDEAVDPGSRTHFVNLRTDDFSSSGDQEGPAPWMAEDVLVYRTSYRVGVFGEFYSHLLEGGESHGIVDKIDIFPWMKGLEEEPNPNPEDPAPWVGLDGERLE